MLHNQAATLKVNSASSFSSGCLALLTTNSFLDSTRCSGATDGGAVRTKETDLRSMCKKKRLLVFSGARVGLEEGMPRLAFVALPIVGDVSESQAAARLGQQTTPRQKIEHGRGSGDARRLPSGASRTVSTLRCTTSGGRSAASDATDGVGMAILLLFAVAPQCCEFQLYLEKCWTASCRDVCWPHLKGLCQIDAVNEVLPRPR